MTQEFDTLKETFFAKFTEPRHLKDWCLTFLGVDLPLGHIDPDSNSSPVEWMYEAYDNYRHNRGNQVRGYVVLSSRESYKTLSESIWAIIMMCHFGCSIAHMAAIESQGRTAFGYIEKYLEKVKPFIEASGLVVVEQNSRNVIIKGQTGWQASVALIIATLQGANSPHTNIMSIDEVDVMRFPQAYEEAKLIPGVFNGQFPITVATSTRKFAFGLMEKEINDAPKKRRKVLRWNILDVTERCGEERHRPNEPKVKRWVGNELPLSNMSEEQHKSLSPEDQKNYREQEGYAGCAECPLLQVCGMRLANRSKEDRGGLYKPIDFTIGQFEGLDPDMADAQLLCNKPSRAGLIYKRFDEREVVGNTLTLDQAMQFLGVTDVQDVTIDDLAEKLFSMGAKFKAFIDWGFTHYFVITVAVQVANGDRWILDCFAYQEMDPDEKVQVGKRAADIYKKVRFWPDNEDPSMIKMFRKNKLLCTDFKKDVAGGINETRTLIVDATLRRRLKVIKHKRTEQVLEMFRKHHFKLDAAGEPTDEPDDDELADIGDTVRYMGQIMGLKGLTSKKDKEKQKAPAAPGLPPGYQGYHEQMAAIVKGLTGGRSGGQAESGPVAAGSMILDFSGDAPIEEVEDDD